MKTPFPICLETTPAPRSARRGFGCFALAAMIFAGVSATTSFAVEGITEAALAQMRAFQQEKLARTPAQKKLDSQIVYALRQSRNELATFGITNVHPNLRFEADGRLTVDIDATVTPALLDQITQAGGQVVSSIAQFHSIRARIPIAQAETLVMGAGVKFMQPAVGYITRTGSVDSEGDTTHIAALARNVFRVDGSGVNIGVISDSDDFLPSSQATGDLPGDVTVIPGQSGVPGTGEGTAMMEIVYDLAPGAKLIFATGGGGPANFAQNVLNLRAAGSDVLVDDIFYLNESPFQDGVIAQAVNTVTAGGAIYFSAAGNEGNKKHNFSGTWEGDFVDGGAVGSPLTGNGILHSFGATNYDTVNAFGIATVLFWSDPLGAATNDYDLYVLDSTGNTILTSSTTVQNGTQDPFEIVAPPAPGNRVVIVKSSGDPRFLHLDTIRGLLAINTDGNTKGHSSAVNAYSVAAIDVATAFPNPFSGGGANPVEFFSSDGPRRVFYQVDGTPITPGNFLATGGAVRQKPDIAAANGVTTTVPGFAPFFGTSAAAPHAAAIAALLKSYNPTLTPGQIRQILTGSALDIEAPGYDFNGGSGIVMALQAIEASPVVVPAPNLVYVTNVVSGGNGNGLIELNECNDMSIILTNVGRATATGVRATLSTFTPGVVIAQPVGDYTNMPVGTAATNVIPFRVSTAPNFNCGMPIRFTLIVKSDQNTVTNRFTVSTGTPGPVLHFSNNNPIPIPDNDARGTNSLIVVSNVPFAINKVTVSLYINHTFDGDLTLQLISPDGVTNTLSSHNGFFGDNYGVSCGGDNQRTTFDDAATLPITQGSPPFLGFFQPEQPLSIYLGKSGTNLNGIWTLHVVDDAFFDVGALNCWTLNITPTICIDGGGECPGADLAIGMVAQPEPALVGGNLTYTISVTNKGPSTAKNVSVSHALPSSTIYVSSTASQGSCSLSGGVVSCSLGDMPALSTATITVVVTPTATGVITSSASVSSTQPDFDTSNNSAIVVSHVSPPTSDIVVGISAQPNPVVLGATLTYTVSITNKGPSTATGVVVTNVLPFSAAILSSTVSQGSLSASSNVVVCFLGTMTSGGEATATIAVSPTAEGQITAISTAVANQFDPTIANNSATNVTAVGPAADLALTLTDSPDPVVLNSNLNYVITITNRGPSAASSVVVNCSLASSVIIVSTNTTQGTINVQGSSITCNVGALQSGGSATITVLVTPTLLGSVSASASVTSAQTDPNPANNSATASTQVSTPFVSIVPAGATLTAESMAPPNGAIDAGETVTISLRLRNAGNVRNTNLVATLLATNGIIPVPPNNPQTYAILAPSGFPVGRTFSFTANGTNGQAIAAVLQLQDGPNNLGQVSFNFILPDIHTFSNTDGITIRDDNKAMPYPSTISVSGLSGVVGKVTATLSNISHTFPEDIDALVVGAGGQDTILMSGAGAPTLDHADITFDDSAASPIPDGTTQILSGSYRPANYTSLDLPNPAPGGPYAAAMSMFNAVNPNGTWSLYVDDHTGGDVGSIDGGWSLTFTMITPVNQLADLVLSGVANPGSGLAGSPLVYTFTVTNGGPNAATFATLTNNLPAGVTLLAVSASQGSLVTNAASIVANLGPLNPGSNATVIVTVSPSAANSGLLTNIATVGSAETDPNPANNQVSVVSSVNLPLADAAVSAALAPNPPTIGLPFTNTIVITNRGPGLALELALTNPIPAGFSLVSLTSTRGNLSSGGGVIACQFGNVQAGGSATVTAVLTPSSIGTFTNNVLLSNRSSDANLANNSTSQVFSVIGLVPNIVGAGTVLDSESGPVNGAVDPGETVTVELALRNTGTADATNVIATLQNSGGVTPVGVTQKGYGRLNHGGSAGTNSFTFVASGGSGGAVVATLNLVDGSGNPLGAVPFVFSLPTTTTFSNGNAIIIPDHGGANPYPSTIAVSGLTGLVSKATITLNGVSHSFPRDINALLVSPAGGRSLVISHAGGAHAITNLTLTFDDAATGSLPNGAQMVGGTFKPTAFGSVTFPPPAPSSGYIAALAAVNGRDPNGTWSLFVFDDSNGDGGNIASGWTLQLTTATTINPVADLQVGITSAPLSMFVGGTVTNTIVVSNLGPVSASAVVVTHALPLGATYISASSSQGSVSGPSAGVVTANLGSIALGGNARVTIVEAPSLAGTMFNIASASAFETDLNLANNTAQFNVSVISPTIARLAAGLNNGQVEVTVSGEPNVPYILQGSTNLISWVSLTTNSSATGTFKYPDPNSQALSARYYRAVRRF